MPRRRLPSPGAALRPRETPIVQACLYVLRSIPGVHAWRINTGTLRDRTGRPVSFAPLGSADISGIVGPEGWRLEVECKRDEKAARAQLSPAQHAWSEMVRTAGGIWFLAWEPAALRLALIAEINRRRKIDE